MAALNQRPITEQIEQLKSKIDLLEGDRKAYKQTAEWSVKKNDEKIGKLRKENKDLRKQLADRLAADDHVIGKALEDHPDERKMLTNKTGADAVTLIDYRLCDTMKRLNAYESMSRDKESRLEQLEARYEALIVDQEATEATDVGESPEGQRLRSLENRYDKAQLKCTEAEHIKQTYEQVRAKLEEEHMQFENVLREMERDIRRSRAELNELKKLHADAQLSRDVAVKEMHKQEEQNNVERKKREVELKAMRQQAEERRQHYDRSERRQAQRSGSGTDDLDRKTPQGTSLQATQSGSGAGAQAEEGPSEQQKKITSYEEAFHRIKDATGVSDMVEVVIRFENQDSTRDRLEEMQEANKAKLTRLEEEGEKLEKELERLKFTGETKLSSGQKVLEEFEEHLRSEEKRLKECRARLNKLSKLLIQVKAGIEHLFEKLQAIKLDQSHVPGTKVPPTSDEYVLDLVSRCEERLLKLQEELRKQAEAEHTDLEATLRQLEDEDFRARMETNLPQYNIRIKLPSVKKDGRFEEEEEGVADEEDAEIPTRNGIKKQSQQLIESKNKRKVAKKKKKSQK